MAVARHRAQEVFRLLVPFGRHGAPPAMRPRTDPGIIAIAPIGQIMAAFLAGAGVIAGFIGRQTGLFRAVLRACEELRSQIVVHRRKFAAAHIAREARALLDRQLIERQMPGAETERAIQLGLPGVQRLTGQGVDQIEADAIELLLRGIEGGQPFGDVMRPPEELQRGIIERLEA